MRPATSQVRRIRYYAVAQHVSVCLESLASSGRFERRGAALPTSDGPMRLGTSTPRLRHDAFALRGKALTYNAARGSTALADPARQSVARPGRAPPEGRTRAAVARSTGSTQAAAAVRPGRALWPEGRWTPGSSAICTRAAAAVLDRLQAAVGPRWIRVERTGQAVRVPGHVPNIPEAPERARPRLTRAVNGVRDL